MPDINFSKVGSAGIIHLDREKKLNALTPEMLILLHEELIRFEADEEIRHVLIYAKGERAFCSGFDIRYFYEVKDPEQNGEFCSYEYRVNQQLFHYSKPYIALIDGMVMGGGVGISQHGRYQIATENYQFAMPEMHIGFFPDVASSSFFVKMPCHIGWYLALTGSRVGLERGIALGLVTHAITREEKEVWIERIMKTQDVEKELREIAVQPSFKPTDVDLEIEQHFSKDSLETTFQSLERSGTPFAQETLKLLRTLPPLSLLVTFELLKRAESMTFDEVIAMDTRVAKAFMKEQDLYEGIRAKIIDKDGAPKWSYPSIERVPRSHLFDLLSS